MKKLISAIFALILLPFCGEGPCPEGFARDNEGNCIQIGTTDGDETTMEEGTFTEEEDDDDDTEEGGDMIWISADSLTCASQGDCNTFYLPDPYDYDYIVSRNTLIFIRHSSELFGYDWTRAGYVTVSEEGIIGKGESNASCTDRTCYEGILLINPPAN